MSKYKYILRDYHAIKEAEISIDGITVLSGINGCGKSTLSRWLYYLIKGATRFESLLFTDYFSRIEFLIDRMQVACTEVERVQRFTNQSVVEISKSLNEMKEAVSKTTVFSSKDIMKLQEVLLRSIQLVEEFLSYSVVSELSPERKKRIVKYFDETLDDYSEESIHKIFDKYKKSVNEWTEKHLTKIEERPINAFKEVLLYNFGISGKDFPALIQLMEDGVEIMEEEYLGRIFNLHNVIYIDSPMSITTETTDNVFWRELSWLSLEDSKAENSQEIQILLRIIKNLLGGEVIVEENKFFNSKYLTFQTGDKKTRFALREAATGYKTFAYLQRLLENGYLNKETLLLIDEPEVYLHPQWIVEFARLLVLFHKKLGLKIVIASHNPDMVAAIRDISKKEGVLENVNFYVAQPDEENSQQFVYKDLGQDVEEIFKSFNKALDSINNYGESGL